MSAKLEIACGPGVSCHDFAEEQCIVRYRKQCQQSKGILNKIKGFRDEQPPGPTYLLSVSRLCMLHNKFPRETMSSLLSVPNTIIIFLVPVQLIFHPHLFSYSRLPKGTGSCMQIFAFDPLSDKEDPDLVKLIGKLCKQRPINGFMSFDEDWPSRCRLASIVKDINSDRKRSIA